MQITLELIVVAGIASLALLLDIFLLISLIRLRRHYNVLTKGVEKKTLMQALEGIQKTLSQHERTQAVIKHELHTLQDDTRLHLQNLILKRFNPFNDTGGDQSFILGMLDGNQTGVVITSLHSRENTRFYVKSVKGGVGIDHPLSAEEQKLINRKAK
ncbi:MAG: hypothetical protein ACD_40C00052G0001 [uncultured bacterium]|nr:MAG: hypothetical protein ACD_40C00052G0001 [uncultured bacterium]